MQKTRVQSEFTQLKLSFALSALSVALAPLLHAQSTPPPSEVQGELISDSAANEYAANIKTSVVVVTASGFSQEVKDAPASISVVSAKELAKKPFRDVTDALRDIPGVTITGGGGSTDISIRGMSSQYTLMLVDGKRQNSRATRPNSDGSGIEQGWIPPLSAIERVEVVRGPMSSLYGSDAMGGVINIITKKVSDRWGGSVRLESTIQERSSSGNANTVDFFINGPLVKETLGLQIYGKYSGREEDKYLEGFPEQKLYNINGKLVYTPNSDHTFEIEAGAAHQKRLATKGRTADFRESDHRSRRTSQALRYYGTWGKANSDFLITHEKTDNYVRKMVVDNYNIQGNVVIPIASHMVTLGAQYRNEKLDDKGNQYNPDITKLSRWNYALFVEDEWHITDNFALTGGLRYDYDENYGKHFNPRLYAVWNITDEFTLKGGVSTGFTAPALRQVVADWGQVTGGGRTNGMILGNPNLKPEKSTNYELSFNYANDNGLEASITGFYTKFRDKIQSITECDSRDSKGKVIKGKSCTAGNGGKFDFIQSRENVDRATLQGVELAAKIPLPYEVVLTTSYTWTKTEQKSGASKGKVLNRIPDHQFNLGLDWDVNERWNLWTKVAYNGKETEAGRGNAADKHYSAYTLLDIGTTFKINDNNTLYAGVYNITNKKIRDEKYGRVQDGRRYWIGLNYEF